MLADFMRERELQPGQRILCFVPESGRFTVAFMMLEVVKSDAAAACRTTATVEVLPPHDPACASAPQLRTLLTELASIWHDYRSRAWRTPTDPQDHDRPASRLPTTCAGWRAGFRRCAKAASGCAPARSTSTNATARWHSSSRKHAGEEQFDYKILFDDYRRAGGDAPSIDALVRNPGGEALNAYMHALARQPNPIGLLGAIYIIEGTGQRIIPALLPLLRKQLDMPGAGVSLPRVSRRERCEPPGALADCRGDRAWRSTPPAQRRRSSPSRAPPPSCTCCRWSMSYERTYRNS